MVQSSDESHPGETELDTSKRDRNSFLPSIGKKPRKRTKNSKNSYADFDIAPVLSLYLRSKKLKGKKFYFQHYDLGDDYVLGTQSQKVNSLIRNSSKNQKLLFSPNGNSSKKSSDYKIMKSEKKYEKFPEIKDRSMAVDLFNSNRKKKEKLMKNSTPLPKRDKSYSLRMHRSQLKELDKRPYLDEEEKIEQEINEREDDDSQLQGIASRIINKGRNLNIVPNKQGTSSTLKRRKIKTSVDDHNNYMDESYILRNYKKTHNQPNNDANEPNKSNTKAQ